MNRDKQIEEMTEIIGDNTEFDTMWSECEASAKALYEKGYRKASEVAEEIFTEIETYLFYHEELPTIYKTIDKHIFESIKKKYIPSCSTCKHITGCERCRAGKPCESYERE